MAERLRVAHIITDLDIGGAELVLARLCGGMDPQLFEQIVVSIKPAGVVAEKIKEHGIPVISLGMNPASPRPAPFFRLIKCLRSFRPHVIQTWMYHADLMGGLAAFLGGHFPVIWGVRNNYLVPGASKTRTIRIARLLAFLSRRLPARIVSCSETARRVHIDLGYRAEKFIVIPNGFDLDRFHPDPSSRLRVRQALGLPPDMELIGLAARFDPNKDHENFIRAAGKLLERRPEVHFLLCGEGISLENRTLMEWIAETGHADRFHLLGRREDMPEITAALDVATSASFSEAFPNVIGEAMACGVPVVATDAGDSAFILGETGRVVPPHDPAGLAGAWLRVLELDPADRQALSQAVRRRMEDVFSLEGMISRYRDLYRTVSGTSSYGTISDL